MLVRKFCFWILLLTSAHTTAVPMYESALTGKSDARSEPEYVAYRQAQHEFSNGKPYAASRYYQNALNANPNFFPALIGLAEIADAAGQSQKAQEYFSKAFNIAKDSGLLHTAYGKFLLKQGKLNEAEKEFEQALKLNPEIANAHGELAVIALSQKNDAKKAVQHYQQASKFDPANMTYLYGLSTAQHRSGQLNEAISTLKKITKKLSDNAQPWQFMGLYYMQSGQANNAIDPLETASRLAPDNADIKWLLGEVYTQSGRPQQALDLYQRMIDKKIKSDAAHMKRALIFHALNKLSDAEKAYQAALNINPQLADAYNNLAYITIQTEKNYEQGLRWAKKAVGIDPDNPAFLDTLGWLQFKTGDHKSAKDNLTKAANGKPETYDAHFHLAKVYEHLGDAAQAKKHFEIAKQIQNSQQH